MPQTQTPPDVRPGQVWGDADPRMEGRTFKVLHLSDDHARARVVVLTLARNVYSGAGRQHWIKLDRFRLRSNGYVLLADAPSQPTP